GRVKMNVEEMWSKGMQGEGTVVGIIDSGIDASHPDLKDRILDYADFTEEGKKDGIGHGTHVAGSVGGSGAASDGQYKGMAPAAASPAAALLGGQFLPIATASLTPPGGVAAPAMVGPKNLDDRAPSARRATRATS
ncbi:MAG: peptidase S8 and S53 subtilisin kexin sedolisin, partial [Elusimicrobia bacterium]